MTKVENVLQKYGATWDDVVKWASTQPKWSKFVSNKRLIASQYLAEVKKVKAQEELGMGMKALQEVTAKLIDLEVGKWHTVKGIIASQQRENSYKGCPTCFKKIAEGGECEVHGEDPVDLYWRTYIFADDTDDVILSVPPKLQSIQILGKEIVVRGNLNDQLEFHAGQIQVLDTQAGIVEQPVAPSTQTQPTQPTQLPAAPAPPTTQPTPTTVTTVIPEELQQFTDIIKLFKSMDMPTLETWHSKNNIKTPLQMLIITAGFKITGNIVSVNQ